MFCGRNAGSASCEQTVRNCVGVGINTLPKRRLTVYWSTKKNRLVLCGKCSPSVVGGGGRDRKLKLHQAGKKGDRLLTRGVFKGRGGTSKIKKI